MKQLLSNTTKAKAKAHQNAAKATIKPPSYVTIPRGAEPFWEAVVTSRARDTWTPADLVLAANLARTQFALESMDVGSDEHAKLTRLALALSRSIAVHTRATVGRAADMVGNATNEREARAEREDANNLIPFARAL